jgi:ATP-dependent DNA helicase DinG
LALVVDRLGGSPRSGQQQMVTEVAAAIAGEKTLLVQAGTGTGKSIGYLVPAACHAVAEQERVIVATATLTLQRQLLSRDLPILAEVLQPLLPRELKFSVLKGRQNYLCKYKLDGGYPIDEFTLFDDPIGANSESSDAGGSSVFDNSGGSGSVKGAKPKGKTGKSKRNGPSHQDQTESFADQVRRARDWAQTTTTGDRDDLVPGVSDRAWRQVSVTSLECLGNKCPMLADCFSEAARNAAREADIVVTNHAMLGVAATGSPGVLPEYDVLVVDEAHNLESAVISGATVELSLPIIERTARTAKRHLGVATERLDDAGKQFGIALAACAEGRFTAELPEALRSAVALLRDATRPLITPEPAQRAAGGQSAGNAEADGGAKVAQAALLSLFEVAERIADPNEAEVLWCVKAEDGFSRLYAGPQQVAMLIKERLLEDSTGVFTSATLALGDSFTAAANSLGLAADGYKGVDVGSPFDYGKQGILYVAAHLPRPGREPVIESQLDEIEALIRAAGGRTLGLFSSRAAAEVAATAMRERLATPVFLQGDDQLPTLISDFAADPSASLFGTFSLWQGVDVPGASCQLVIIDKLGFPRPDDPISSARVQAVEQRGGNGFMAVSAAHSALRLAQAAGRLIRRSNDRGVVAVLDPRLQTARYAGYLVASLPPFWRTTNRDVVLSALQRLDAAAKAANPTSA